MADWRDWDLDEIPEWPNKAQNILLIVSFVLLFFLSLYLLIFPLKKHLNQALHKEQSLKKQFQVKIEQGKQLANIKAQIRAMKKAHQKLISPFLNENELAKLLDSINKIGLNNNLSLERINWQQGQQLEHFFERSIKLQMKGTFKDFGTFSQELAILPQIISVQKLQVQTVPSNLQGEKKHASVQQTNNPKELYFYVTAYTYSFSHRVEEG